MAMFLSDGLIMDTAVIVGAVTYNGKCVDDGLYQIVLWIWADEEKLA